MSLSILDWAFVFVIAVSVLGAISQGFFYELFGLAGAVAGYLVAAWEYRHVASWYLQYMKSPWAADIAGFLTIFFVIVLLAGFAGRLVRGALRKVGLRWFDRVLGAVFGVLRGAAICTVIVLVLASFVPTSSYLRDSRFAPFLLATGRAMIWAAPAELRERFRDGWNLLRSVPEHVGMQRAAD
jgi:membrane protein required for colicin V production